MNIREGYHQIGKEERGCELWDDCFSCPLPQCKEDIYLDQSNKVRGDPRAIRMLIKTHQMLQVLLGSFPTAGMEHDGRKSDFTCVLRTKELVEMLLGDYGIKGNVANIERRDWLMCIKRLFRRGSAKEVL